MLVSQNKCIFIFCVCQYLLVSGCQKTTTAPAITGVADFTIVDAIPNNAEVIPVINTAEPIEWFGNAYAIPFGWFYQYSITPGSDTVYVVQGSDTLNIGPKATGQMFYGILPIQNGRSYSLFLCGADTTSPDYLLTTDTLPYHARNDSTVGIRFVNLSTGSNPISINLEGSPIGSEAGSLAYKSITGFRNYISNSSVTYGGYSFVFRDATTGDSLAIESLAGFGSSFGVGLQDPFSFGPLVFKNITIALIGQPEANSPVPLQTIVIDNY
jgi:hypothetical protein